MKQSIARVLRRLADRFDPAGQRTSVTNITVNNCRATTDVTARQQAQRDSDLARSQWAAASKAADEAVAQLRDARSQRVANANIVSYRVSENRRAWDAYMENHAPPRDSVADA
ncbi:hypothetical protein ACRYGU_16575 [Mycobacteroides abscessus]